MPMNFEMSAGEAAELVSVSKGKMPAHIFLRNGHVVNVFSGEILKANIATYKNRIAYVGPSEKMITKETLVLDVNDNFCLPGFIDVHCHPDLFSNPAAFCDYVVNLGTTTIVVDSQDMCNSFGLEGFEEIFIQSLHYPVRTLFLAPAVTPPFPGIEGDEAFDIVQVNELLKRERVLGLAEITPYMRLIHGDRNLLARIALARNAKKKVEGHTSGASYEKLNTLVASGLTSCHEAVTADDFLSRLRLGLYTLVRSGSIRCELEELAPLLRIPPACASHRVILTPDGLFPDQIMDDGYMDHVVRKAVSLGVQPVHAIQMATINPALYLGLDHDLGAIAPRRLADIHITGNLQDFHSSMVIRDGRLVFVKGKSLIKPSPRPSIRDQGKPFSLDTTSTKLFKVKAPNDMSRGIPVAVVENKTMTRRVDMRLPTRRGYVEADPKNDVLKVSVLLRNGALHNCGFVKGLGVDVDALCSSVCHEIQEIVVIGRDDDAMLVALKRVKQIKGGLVLVKDRKVIHEMRLPIGGTMSEKSLEEIAKELRCTKDAFKARGCKLQEPLWTIGFLTFSALIELRITVSGVYDVKEGRIVFDSRTPLF